MDNNTSVILQALLRLALFSGCILLLSCAGITVMHLGRISSRLAARCVFVAALATTFPFYFNAIVTPLSTLEHLGGLTFASLFTLFITLVAYALFAILRASEYDLGIRGNTDLYQEFREQDKHSSYDDWLESTLTEIRNAEANSLLNQ